MNQEKIDWTRFKDKYVRFVTGVEKKLKLTNWTAGEWFGKPGISFDVVEEDGVVVTQRQFTAISARLIRAVKPIILKAEEEDRAVITLSILRTGEGLNTRYIVKEYRHCSFTIAKNFG